MVWAGMSMVPNEGRASKNYVVLLKEHAGLPDTHSPITSYNKMTPMEEMGGSLNFCKGVYIKSCSHEAAKHKSG
jgi:tRNA(Leu) C34 or U34 (ribose-2'-O)-methylase TrmL